ncbi:hypothetical protein CD122_10765 [Staphylococcus rostri]|uniref:Uncharacterized protein n=1 Tax=Staphylococcus rostri TaxID=522262 RepID=A0A2K3YGI3_9STAP|nr:hypothetical protein [Staphylococcus rostri]PNZ24695.1 hypothetical protein CD122_10765 [Staphylococcus rostri]
MPKIKVKKQVGLEELLNLLSNDEIEQGEYRGSKGTCVYPNEMFFDDFEIDGFKAEDRFEIEVEQEIDEHTKLDGLVEKFEDCNGYVDYTNFESAKSIKAELEKSKAIKTKSLAFYLAQDNHELKLIWKDGELVE